MLSEAPDIIYIIQPLHGCNAEPLMLQGLTDTIKLGQLNWQA